MCVQVLVCVCVCVYEEADTLLSLSYFSRRAENWIKMKNAGLSERRVKQQETQRAFQHINLYLNCAELSLWFIEKVHLKGHFTLI